MSTYRFGKLPPKIDYRTLRFQTYLTPELTAPPPACDVLKDRVYKNLGTSATSKLFPMDGNDHNGDCAIAAVAHAITIYRGMIKKKSIMPAAKVIKLYFHLTGGIDSGLAELDVLNHWRQQAIGGEKILAFASIDYKNHTHVKQAIWLFGAVYLGFHVPENCESEFNAHKPWTPGSLTRHGHAVVATAYDSRGVTVLTWGTTQRGTWAWWDECVDEAYAILPPQAKNKEFAHGFNFAQLQTDLKAVAS